MWSMVCAALPILFGLLFWVSVFPAWFCSGVCCIRPDRCAKVKINGTYAASYSDAVDAFVDSLSQGWDLGASMFVMVDGETVVDVAGGFKNKEKTETYGLNTVNLIFSSGKVIETIGMALLVDKQLVALDDPISKHWPEFAQKGKGDITIQDLLSHRSGSSTLFEHTPNVSVLQKHDTRDAFLASQKFFFPRGTISYRAYGSAMYSDAICRKVDPQGRTLARLVQDEIFTPMHETFFCPPIPNNAVDTSLVFDIPVQTVILGMFPQLILPKKLRDLYLPASHPMYFADAEVALFRNFFLKKGPDAAFAQPTVPDVDKGAASWNNVSSFLSYESMSSNCFSNARAIGKGLDAFMSGKLVSKETLEKFLMPFPPAKDVLMGITITHNAGGFGEMTALMPDAGLEGKNCWGWAGNGGSAVVHCRVGGKKITFAYVMNGLSTKLIMDRAGKLLRRILDTIK